MEAKEQKLDTLTRQHQVAMDTTHSCCGWGRGGRILSSSTVCSPVLSALIKSVSSEPPSGFMKRETSQQRSSWLQRQQAASKRSKSADFCRMRSHSAQAARRSSDWGWYPASDATTRCLGWQGCSPQGWLEACFRLRVARLTAALSALSAAGLEKATRGWTTGYAAATRRIVLHQKRCGSEQSPLFSGQFWSGVEWNGVG